jgi:hypothetical protein
VNYIIVNYKYSAHFNQGEARSNMLSLYIIGMSLAVALARNIGGAPSANAVGVTSEPEDIWSWVEANPDVQSFAAVFLQNLRAAIQAGQFDLSNGSAAIFGTDDVAIQPAVAPVTDDQSQTSVVPPMATTTLTMTDEERALMDLLYSFLNNQANW